MRGEGGGVRGRKEQKEKEKFFQKLVWFDEIRLLDERAEGKWGRKVWLTK
jgi:hypothetical protein